MFLAAIAWVKRGGRGEEKIFNIKKNNYFLLNIFFSHLPAVEPTQFDWKKRHAQ